MDLSDAMVVYFRGERHLGFGLAAAGVAMLAAAFWLRRTQSGTFATWLLVSLAVVGLAMSAGGVFFAAKTRTQVAGLTARLATERGAVVEAESARMARVNANWPRAKGAWGVL